MMQICFCVCSYCLFLTLNQVDVVEAFNFTLKYLDDLLNIYNPSILNISFGTEAPLMYLDLSTQSWLVVCFPL